MRTSTLWLNTGFDQHVAIFDHHVANGSIAGAVPDDGLVADGGDGERFSVELGDYESISNDIDGPGSPTTLLFQKLVAKWQFADSSNMTSTTK